ncbi:MAG: hypothetical protein HQM08_21890 [Candidatus Riflebacteria bacterium]|nr:hypothetical protein [Candidatus Riflebacteria bacterium]
MILCNFESIRPRFMLSQESTLQWLVDAHTRAESSRAQSMPGQRNNPLDREYSVLFQRYACSPKRISTRGVEVEDFTHSEWNKMELFSFNKNWQGPTMTERTRTFQKIGRRIFKKMYPETSNPPDHIIHVTCTGYVSPSCAQELVIRNHWYEKTVVTHAYHMGCYASVPAVRMAEGFLTNSRSKRATASKQNTRVDIIHTEVCSIHVQLGDPSPEQIVVQSLFADGFIKYSAVTHTNNNFRIGTGLKLMATHEQLIPDSLEAISWECSEWGMKMGLSREVPNKITTSLLPFLMELCNRAGVSFERIRPEAIFAVHPGGPRIIDQIQTLLHLSDEQMENSKSILRVHGNMSSATLPHIWESILNNLPSPNSKYILSLAFGPGICISGALFKTIP